jgi:outer membrane protein assembly factor BamB
MNLYSGFSIRRRLLLACAGVLSILLHAPTNADDWPQWLGANRDGVWWETGILRTFGPEGPKLLWRKKISSGYSGPAVAKGRVYVTDRVAESGNPATEQKDHYARRRGPGTERVLCLSASDGATLWKYQYDCPYTMAYPAGPRATPTVDGSKVYTLGAEGNLVCFDAGTGDVIWSCDFKKRYRLKVPTWGVCGAPLVDGDKLICIVGGQGTTAVALDKDSGKEIFVPWHPKAPATHHPLSTQSEENAS